MNIRRFSSPKHPKLDLHWIRPPVKGSLFLWRLITHIYNPVTLSVQLFSLTSHTVNIRSEQKTLQYLEQRGEHVKSVDGTGSVRVRHELVDVTSPSLLCIVAHCGLEGCEDGGEEGRRWRGRAGLQHVVSLLLCKTERTQGHVIDNVIFFITSHVSKITLNEFPLSLGKVGCVGQGSESNMFWCTSGLGGESRNCSQENNRWILTEKIMTDVYVCLKSRYRE